MPTLPTSSIFDKDFSLRSPFPRHIATVVQTTHPPSAQSLHDKTRPIHARADYSQIKRPTPVKPKPSPSVSDLQLAQADVPHSLRNFVPHSKPQLSLKRPMPDRELDRMYLASPMPKVIDQAYSSLTTILQRQKANSLVIPQPLVFSKSEPSIPHPPKISPSNADTTNSNPQATTLGSTPKKHGTPASSLTSDNDDFNGPLEIEGDLLRTPEPTTDGAAEPPGDSRILTPSGSRLAKETSQKRKSRSRRIQTTHEPAAKRRRVSKVSPNTEPYIRAHSSFQSHPPPECEDFYHSDNARGKNALSKSRVHGREISRPKLKGNRIRSAVSQFFKGSFWDPPTSPKRARRPPSQWWMPPKPSSKSNQKFKKSAQECQAASINDSQRNEGTKDSI